MSNLKRQIQKAKIAKTTKSITSTFLEGVYFALGVLGELHNQRYSVYSSIRKGVFSDWDDAKISKKMREMARVGYIRINPENNSIEFTDKARLKIVDTLSEQSGSDGKNRFISFDIPEKKRVQRDGFRRTIKRIGFRKIQKSLWVCDKNVGELVEIAKREYDVDNYVIYIVSEKSDIDDYIKDKLEDVQNNSKTTLE